MSEETKNDVTFKEIWETLSKVNVNEQTEEKGGLTYLSWAWAWDTLMKHYPEAEYEFSMFTCGENGNEKRSILSHIGARCGVSFYCWL